MNTKRFSHKNFVIPAKEFGVVHAPHGQELFGEQFGPKLIHGRTYPPLQHGQLKTNSQSMDSRLRGNDKLAVLFAGALLLSQPLSAQGTGPIPELANQQLENPAQEAEATRLMQSLRCIQCQSQSIADSDAPMAASMRAEVRQQIAGGKKTAEVRSWMIQRYGQWVSFEPEMRGAGLLLWIAPLLLLAVAVLLARRLFRKSHV